jgi:8-oxo-dGTP pyrophosphatase MutT (NUDIX family)
MIIKHSAGGLVIKGGKVLTISRNNRDYISFPKGGIDEGETSEMAAIREVYEETGYRVNILAPIKSWTFKYGGSGKKYQKTVDYYLMALADNNPPTPHREPDEDFHNLWLDIDEAYKRLTYSDGREALELAKGLHYDA